MRVVCWIVVAALSLSACQKAREAPAAGVSPRARYVGVGIYMPGDLWRHLARPQPTTAPDPAAATLADDEQVIVVLDSATGEVRQCGNLSGHCVGLNPWSTTASTQSAPAPLLKHAQDLQREFDARIEVVPAPAQK